MFITFEGPEGAGKSTNIAYFASALEQAGCSVLVTREPGGTVLSEKIRELLISTEFKGMAVDTELLLMFAARAEHLNQVILPAIKQGQVVLCDRFTDATYAYQGGGRGVDKSKIALLENLVQGGLRPDLIFLFDLEADVGLSRVKQSRQGLDRFEQENLKFFEAVRSAYWQRVELDKDRYRIVDASQPLEIVQKQLDGYLADVLRCLNA